MRVEGPANMYVDNALVVKSVTMSESRPKKKNLSIFYHDVREAVDGGKVLTGWVSTGINIAGLLTKILEGPNIRDIFSKILH